MSDWLTVRQKTRRDMYKQARLVCKRDKSRSSFNLYTIRKLRLTSVSYFWWNVYFWTSALKVLIHCQDLSHFASVFLLITSLFQEHCTPHTTTGKHLSAHCLIVETGRNIVADHFVEWSYTASYRETIDCPYFLFRSY